MGEHDLARLRTALGRFATGVAVVAFDGPDGRHGMTINSFTSVSMRPPLVLASVARKARAHDALEGQPFSISILGAEQEPGRSPQGNHQIAAGTRTFQARPSFAITRIT